MSLSSIQQPPSKICLDAIGSSCESNPSRRICRLRAVPLEYVTDKISNAQTGDREKNTDRGKPNLPAQSIFVTDVFLAPSSIPKLGMRLLYLKCILRPFSMENGTVYWLWQPPQTIMALDNNKTCQKCRFSANGVITMRMHIKYGVLSLLSSYLNWVSAP